MYLRSTLHELMQLSTYSYCDPRVKRALETAVSRQCTHPGRTACNVPGHQHQAWHRCGWQGKRMLLVHHPRRGAADRDRRLGSPVTLRWLPGTAINILPLSCWLAGWLALTCASPLPLPQVDQRVNLPAYTVGRKTPAVATLGLLAFASLRIVNESSLLSRPAEAQQQLLQSVALDHYLPDGLEDLEQYQRTALGLESPLTDKDLRVLLCLLRHKAATTLLSGRAGGVSLDPAMLEAQCSTAERLLEELLPGDASLLLRSALAKQPQCSPEATQACRAALQAAHAERAHFVAAGAGAGCLGVAAGSCRCLSSSPGAPAAAEAQAVQACAASHHHHLSKQPPLLGCNACSAGPGIPALLRRLRRLVPGRGAAAAG